jgi:hypothetical protein
MDATPDARAVSLCPVPSEPPPGASGGARSRGGDAQVEYRLMRNAVVEDVRRGRRLRTDVCDAHPELLRAARHVGSATGEECPICEERDTVEVTFVFGAKLPPGGRCPGTKTELRRLCAREEPVVCYAVEVCPSCAWHHLTRRYAAGGRTRSGRSARARITERA